MLRRRRGDWFPIVATDLFCGVLAAVIILDAVSPKETSARGSAVLIDIDFENAPRQANEPPANCNDVGRVVFYFREGGHIVNTLEEGGTTGSQNGNVCKLQAFFPEINLDQNLSGSGIIVSEYAGDLREVTVTVTGVQPSVIRCQKGNAACPIQ